MVDLIDGFTPYAAKDAEKYNRLRWWPGLTFGDILDRAADMFPDKAAFVDRRSRLTYARTRDRANRLAVGLMDLGIRPENLLRDIGEVEFNRRHQCGLRTLEAFANEGCLISEQVWDAEDIPDSDLTCGRPSGSRCCRSCPCSQCSRHLPRR